MGRKRKTTQVDANGSMAGYSNPAPEGMNNDEHNQSIPPLTSASKQKWAKRNSMIRRRSARLRSLISSGPNQGVTGETIYIDDIGSEEELDVDNNSEPFFTQSNLEEPNVERLNSGSIFTQQNPQEPIAEELNSEPMTAKAVDVEKNAEPYFSQSNLEEQNVDRLNSGQEPIAAELNSEPVTAKEVDVEKNAEPYFSQSNMEEQNVDRLNSGSIFTQRNSQEPIVEELNSEPISTQHDLDVPTVSGLKPDPIASQQNLEKKIDVLLHDVQELRSKAPKGRFASQTHFAGLNYKSLYIDSQKQVEDLYKENRELAQKLECAKAKLEVYEQICQKILTQK